MMMLKADWKVSNGDVLERLEPFLSIISIIGVSPAVILSVLR